MHSKLFKALALCAVLLIPFQYAHSKSGSFERIPPSEAQELLDDGKVDLLLDVRTMDYFTGPSGRLKGALLIPVHDLEKKLDFLNRYKDKTVLVYCEVGIWSQDAANFLIEKGFRNVLELKGGIEAWKSEGFKVLR